MKSTQQENEIWEDSSNDELNEDDDNTSTNSPLNNSKHKQGSKSMFDFHRLSRETSQQSSSSHSTFNSNNGFEHEQQQQQQQQQQQNDDNNDNNNNNTNNDNNHEYTIDEAFSALGMGKFQYCMMVVAGLVWFSAAIQLMLTSTLLLLLEIQWDVTSLQSTCLASVPFVGEMFGAYLISNMADRYGRKKSVIMSALLLALFGTLGALSTNLSMLIVARMAIGFAVGGSINCLTLFTEFTPKEYRGEMTFLELIFWSLGAAICIIIGWICYSININWRWFLLICSVFSWVSTVLACFAPESPRYLCTNGDNAKIEEILQWISRVNKKPLPNGTLKQSNVSNDLHRGNVFDLVLPAYLRSTLLILIITACSVCAYYGIALFQSNYFESVQSSTMDIFWENLVCTCAEFPAILIGFLIIDRVGRIPFLGISFLLVAICCGLLIISNASVGLVLLFIGRMCAAETYNIIVIYILEYYPTVIRSTALGVAITESKLAAILSTYVAENCSTSMASLTFCICSVIALICVSLLPTETFGLALSDDIILTDPSKKLISDDNQDNEEKFDEEEIRSLLNKVSPLKDTSLPSSVERQLEIDLPLVNNNNNNNNNNAINLNSEYEEILRRRSNSL